MPVAFGRPAVDAGSTLATDVELAAAVDAAVASKASRFRSNLSDPTNVNRVMDDPPTVGSLATSTAISSAKTWPAGSAPGSATGLNLGVFTYRQCSGVVSAGTSYPDEYFVYAADITNPSVSGKSSYGADFLFDGTELEIKGKGNGQYLRIRVDGRFVSLTATQFTSDGNIYYLPVTFTSRRVRRIQLDFSTNFYFGGVVTGPTDTVAPCGVPGVRCIIVGDSITDGTGADGGTATSWVRTFAQSMGWDDCWSSGVGATGYLNPSTGGKVKFRDRIVADCLDHDPDVVILAGGLNDYASYSASAIGAEATTLIAQIRAALPDCLIVVLSPFWRNGVETMPYTLLDASDALETAAASDYWISTLTLPLADSTSTTLAASASVGATSLSLTAPVPIQSTIELGTSTSRERRVVTNLTGSGPYTATVAATTYAHTSGGAVTTVGAALWTGTGKVGSTTGSGNSDLIVSSDGTHPSQPGHDLIGTYIAARISDLLPNV